MPKTLKYIEAVPKPNGKVYFYFRRRGKRTPLPGPYNSPKFLEAYWALRNGVGPEAEIGAELTRPGSVSAAIVAFYKHPSFTKNRPITRQTDRNILESFRAKHGDKRIALLQQHHIEAMIGEKAGKPAAQRNLLRVLRVLLNIAVKAKMRRDNPALGIELERDRDVRLSFLDRGRIAALRGLAPSRHQGTACPRPPTLHGAATCRRCGARAAEFEKRSFHLHASKNGARMDIPIAEPLAATIAATAMIGVKTFLVTEYGKPFTPAGFGNWFRRRCDEVGLPHCSAHGLRKAFLRRMAEAGCSEDYIASISGHKDMREIRTYVQAANKAKMATEGMTKTLAAFPAKKQPE